MDEGQREWNVAPASGVPAPIEAEAEPELLPIGAFTFDAAGRVLDVNAAGAAMLGRERRALVGASILPFLAEDGLELFLDHLVACLRDRCRATVRLTILGSDGAAAVLLASVPARGPARGAVRSAVLEEPAGGGAGDSSQRHLTFLAEASAVLAASLDYRTTLASVARLAVPYLGDGCIVDVSERGGALHRVAAAHADPALADLAGELQRERFRDGGFALATAVLGDGQPRIVNDMGEDEQLAAAGDEERCARFRRLGFRSCLVVPMVSRSEILGVISVFSGERAYGARDLDVAKDLAHRAAQAVDNARLYREAQDAVRERDEFLSMASHEFRTPLTALQLQVQMLAESFRRGRADGLSAERVPSQLAGVERQVKRMGRLVRDLLDVSRIRSGRFDLSPRPAALNELVREVAATFRVVSARHAVVVDERDRDVVADLDRDRFEQVLGNLLDNAIKYSPAGGTITVSVARRGDEAVVTVTDPGIGIAYEQQASLFDRFYRTDLARERGIGGLGLGLYICREIVTAHGGRIDVASEPGCGAAFAVSIPARPPVTAGAAAAGAATILVVDDDEEIRVVAARILERLGYRTLTAADGDEAFRRVQDDAPALVLLDLAMPICDGPTFVERLRRHERETGARRLPVVLVSASGELRECARELGLKSWLAKPFDVRDLERIIAERIGE